jgi:hypothetical protein
MKRKYRLIFAVLGFIVFFAIEARAADWKFYGYSDGGDKSYYKPQSIKRVSQDVVQVMTKAVFAPKGLSDIIKMIPPNEKDQFKELSYVLFLVEYNCSEKKVHALSTIYCNRDGSVIHHAGNELHETPWNFVVPRTAGETLFNIVCGSR